MTDPRLSILFVGEAWRGSSARSLCDGLVESGRVCVDDIAADLYLPSQHRSLTLRAANRVLRPLHTAELIHALKSRLKELRPDVLIVYKGAGVSTKILELAHEYGIFAVNIFPDYSPHAFGRSLQQVIGQYDLVISTKPFHPDQWKSTYGYHNPCLFVPHGYDTRIHLWNEPAPTSKYDVVLASNWRPEYHEVMTTLAQEICDLPVHVAIAGSGWSERRRDFPTHWDIFGPVFGRAYGKWLRQGKIVIAPVHTRVCVDGVMQPGDEDTTRTYELAAAYCFFLHKRTRYVETIYDEHTEVPMWDTPQELARLILRYLRAPKVREQMAAAAHLRAVPQYSITSRAALVIGTVEQAFHRRREERNDCS